MAISRKETILHLFEKKIPEHYHSDEIRLSQVQMALEVASFLHPSQRKRILLLEAPVGTGKSLGALVPALNESTIDRFSTKRINYVTATINLQGQLMQGEVPLLQNLGLLKDVILAKGKSHYYCHQELYSLSNINTSKEIIDSFNRFFYESSTGQRDEYEQLYGEIRNEIWGHVSLKATKSDCERCPLSYTCPTNQHRKRFLLNNQLVITNHEQMIRSLLNHISDPPGSSIVPINPGIIIIDEAHHFLENFLSQIESPITIKKLKGIGNDRQFPYKFKKEYSKIVGHLEKELEEIAEGVESLQGRYPIPDSAKSHLSLLLKVLDAALEQLVLQNLENHNKARANIFSEKLESTIEIIKPLLDTKKYVHWITFEEFTFSSIPRNFPTVFREMMNLLIKYNKVIVMSGTLTRAC